MSGNWRQWEAAGSAQQRIAFWKDVVCEAVLDVEMDAERHPAFGGRICSRTQADARFVTFRASRHRIRRTYGQARRTLDGHLMVSLQCRGESRLTQGRGNVILRPGEVGLLDSAEAFDILFPSQVERRIVLLPKALVTPRIPALGRLREPLRVSREQVITSLLAHTIRAMTSTEEPMPESSIHVLLQHLADLLAIALKGTGIEHPRERNGAIAFQAVADHIARQLGDCSLSAASVARAAEMSVRTLHRLFKRSAPGTFERYVIEQRLVLAKRALESGLAHSVSEAAFSCGFNDLSHFTRRFASRFGHTPSESLRAADPARKRRD
jgi:AraC-like DNA-binding protein